MVAGVLYYYRAISCLQGGALEFCSKQKFALWSGDPGGHLANVDNTVALAASLPRCQVPIREGTLVCFSNYAAVHRVLRLQAPRGSGGGSRDFVAFFVIDQRQPLPTPTTLSPLDERAWRRERDCWRSSCSHAERLDSTRPVCTPQGTIRLQTLGGWPTKEMKAIVWPKATRRRRH